MYLSITTTQDREEIDELAGLNHETLTEDEEDNQPAKKQDGDDTDNLFDGSKGDVTDDEEDATADVRKKKKSRNRDAKTSVDKRSTKRSKRGKHTKRSKRGKHATKTSVDKGSNKVS